MLPASRSFHCVKPLAAPLRNTKTLTRTARSVRKRQVVRSSSDISDEAPERVVLPLPDGATKPSEEPVMAPAWFGFVDNAERMNSRFAMIGFFGIILVEAVSGKGLLELLGIAVGSGLGFEF